MYVGLLSIIALSLPAKSFQKNYIVRFGGKDFCWPKTNCMAKGFVSVTIESRPPTNCMVEVFVGVSAESRPLTKRW